MIFEYRFRVRIITTLFEVYDFFLKKINQSISIYIKKKFNFINYPSEYDFATHEIKIFITL